MTQVEIFRIALNRMHEKPRSVKRELDRASEDEDFEPPVASKDLFIHLGSSGDNDPISLMFHQRLAAWDYLESPAWSQNTGRSTNARRQLVYSMLQLSQKQVEFCNGRYPYAPALDAPVAVTNDKAVGWKPWYSEQRKNSRRFYWDAYFNYLRDIKKWDAKNLAVIEESSREVIERLQDPESAVPYQSKGLVVGYVQSGKTANFTGVIARAADAGYRLIIVLAGTINILREQTQRRLDKELVGKEMCSGETYELDEDYDDFVSHGGLPSERGFFDWERLTGSKDDFRRLKRGIAALEFRRYDPGKPFYDPVNLHRERARLLVVKKTPTVLNKLLADLNDVSKRVDLKSVPALIIDDESDQASINTWDTRRPHSQKKDEEARTKTNRSIVELLKLLRRGQYIGYTATPFANVFINPDDAEDLFPADYILSLPRPEGYMGMAEFYDDTPAKDGDYSSNEKAFVRFVQDADDDPDNLPAAIDAYILAGAIKLYRETKSNKKFSYRHHTMLIHNSQSVFVHETQARDVEVLLEQAGYVSGGPGIGRLRELWQRDCGPVSVVRNKTSLSPSSFGDLLPFIGGCCNKLSLGKSVRIINGNNKDDAPNFEKSGVWAILVGGTKLSRGYTVEGLTVSYYRRRAGAADTLMQMGRWFGFRPGYQDLVRLYIGNREPLTKKNTQFINLYEAFRATCQDEEHFRGQLKRYSSLAPGKRITPRQVPPLVAQHMLPPTSKNKMFNAKITFENLGGEWKEATVAPSEITEVEHNDEKMRQMLRGAEITRNRVAVQSDTDVADFEAWTGSLQPNAVLAFLSTYHWLPGYSHSLKMVTEFLRGTGKRDPEISSWLLLAPQLKSKGKTPAWKHEGKEFAVRERTRIETGGRYKAFSEPDHRLASEVFAGVRIGNITAGGVDMRRANQAVLLFYPVRSEEEAGQIPTMGFALLFPENSIKEPIAYSVRDQSRADEVVVPK